MDFQPTPELREAARLTPEGRPVMRQRWSGLLFLHWRIDEALLAARLPPGLYPDTFDGSAWIGVVPFFMERVRPAGFPAMPWLSWFLELNVRTYVHDEAGNPGVWFFSLDCDQPVAVEIARRLFHLPYEHAAMKARTAGNAVAYDCRRRIAGARNCRFEYELPVDAAPAAADSLEWFLVERYLLFSSRPGGRLYRGRVHHEPYRISPGRCAAWSTEPLRWDGFPEPAEPAESVLVAEPVDVRIYGMERCGR